MGSYIRREDGVIPTIMASKMAIEDRRKRTLEALERRFALAKAEIVQQQQHQSNKQFHEVGEKVNHSTNSLPVVSSTPHISNSSMKKDVEENDPAYSQLFQPIHENLLTTNAKISSKRGSTVDKILHELVKNGDSAHKHIMGSRKMRIDNWILLDNVVQGRGTRARIRDLMSHTKNSRKHISMKQNKQCGSLNLPKELHRYDIFKPMHEMWKGYMMQLLKSSGQNQLAQPILSADLHGAIIRVVECKIAAFNGVGGIMIRETAETLGVITQDDKFRVVPKKGSVFIFQVDRWKVTVFGDKLASRNLAV